MNNKIMKKIESSHRMEAMSKCGLYLGAIMLSGPIGFLTLSMVNYNWGMTYNRYHTWWIFPLSFFVWFLWAGRVRKKVIAAQGRLCRHCLYDLTGLPDKHCCPECGQAYDMEEIVGKWRQTSFFPWRRLYDAHLSATNDTPMSTENGNRTPSEPDGFDDPGGYLPEVFHGRQENMFAILIFSVFFGMFIGPLILGPSYFLGSDYGWWVFVAAAMIFSCGMSLVLYRWEAKLHRRMIASKNRLCEYCAYNLTGLPEQSHCPECGKPYDIGRTIRKWQRVRFFLRRKWQPL